MSEQTAFPYIRFWKPSNELIPTDLWLMVGDVKVKYKRIYSGFRFEIYESLNAEKAKETVDKIIEQMLIDHNESKHGVSWRTVSLEEIGSGWNRGHVIYEWHYRVRDSY